ncbi:MAG: DUF192 domain-containing protein [Vampirovibrionales bacterium]
MIPNGYGGQQWLKYGLVCMALSVLGMACCAAQLNTGASPLPTAGVLLGGHPFVLELATTPQALQQGLMGRRQVSANGGMAFLFADAPQFRRFWMKGCLVPLDMVFLNQQRVVHIEHGVQPCLEAESAQNMCPIITTRHNVDMVIELAGGRSRALGLQLGDRLQWLSPSPLVLPSRR